ncbi:MAG: PHP domain-containing protein [Candidatus Cloacimonadia bacterium]
MESHISHPLSSKLRKNQNLEDNCKMKNSWLLCDFHIHTNISDGALSLEDTVDIYGKHGFDAISITDHIIDKFTARERRENGEPLGAIPKELFQDYLSRLWKEAGRAYRKYGMIIIPGTEITNNWGRYHLIGLDIKSYIDPTLPEKEIVSALHQQGAVAIACHPHHKETEGPQQFIHQWEHHEEYRDIFDAWEVANRDDLFNVIGLKKFNYVANSDFHEPRHIYSWKSLIRAEKNPEAIKIAIKENKEIAIYLLRKESHERKSN